MSKTPLAPCPIRATAGLGLATLLALALLLFSFARLLGDIGSAAFDMSIVEGSLTDPFWHTRLALNLVLFALALLALHLSFGMLCWLLALVTAKAFPAARCSRRQWVFLWFLAGTMWLMLVNAAGFAHSSLGAPYHALATTTVLGVTLHVLATGVLLAIIAGVLLMFLYRHATWRRSAYALLGVASLTVATGFTWRHANRRADSAARLPNIVFLGIDSLRPDFVNADTAPHVRAFMDDALQLRNTVTPLARTFPSWISILSGRHPHTTGAYMNLLPREQIITGAMLPQLLHGHGYRTYYAMDETRFANIDSTYGFDRSITSTIGGSDFVISWFADTPLSNVVMNTWLGALLFPHAHANRAAHVTYDPDVFVDRVASAIDPDQPVFLAAHLTLPHWPYFWAASPAVEPDAGNTPELYSLAVHRADRQFGDLLAALQARGILDNAIVVALSDHGEALGHADDLMSDAFTDRQTTAPDAWKWGHGTSVFSPSQYQVVLGIRAYGAARTLLRPPAVLSDPVSLVDLAPTILGLLGMESSERFDGISLAPLLTDGTTTPAAFDERIRFTETEYNPAGLTSGRLTTSALAEAAQVYRLDARTDRLVVRQNRIASILATRQYAVLLGTRAMAIAMPDPHGGGDYEFIYVPDPRGTRDGNSVDAARLRNALQDRFGIQLAENAQLPRSASR